jgi:hypothetical protein
MERTPKWVITKMTIFREVRSESGALLKSHADYLFHQLVNTLLPLRQVLLGKISHSGAPSGRRTGGMGTPVWR